MPHNTTVFHELLKLLPWAAFDDLVARHQSEARTRSFGTKAHLIALLYGQLTGAATLRELVDSLESQSASLPRLGTRAVPLATLADANRTRPSAVFSGLLEIMMKRAHRALRRDIKECVYLIDSTSVRLSDLSAGWARFSEGVSGAKAHIVYDPQADCPVYSLVTPSRVNDITAAHDMPIEPGATYVFDLGYYDFGWWSRMHAANCRIVTRLKSNTPLEVDSERPVPRGGRILSDRVGTLPRRQAKNRKNPFSAPVREIRVRLDSGKVLRIMTNDLKASAQEIADLYKRRWAIELFFRWIKQVLRIKKFIGASENAIRIQVAVALIAFLLLRLAQKALGHEADAMSPLSFARTIRVNLMHRRRLDELHRPPRRRPAKEKPMEFACAA